MGLRRWLKECIGIESLKKRLDRIEAAQRDILLQTEKFLGKAAECSILNQVALATRNDSGVLLRIPGGNKERVFFDITEEGRLCFKRPRKSNQHQPKVFITTIPKSGTYLIGETLSCLGFQHLEVHGADGWFTDARGITKEETLATPPRLRRRKVSLSYAAQVDLVMPGQYHLGHLSADVMRRVHVKKSFILGVRDLRRAIVSWVSRERFIHNQYAAVPKDSITAADLNEYLRSNGPGAVFFGKEAAKMRDDALVVRFEELSCRDREKAGNSIRSLAEVSSCDEDEVFAALLQAFGKEGSTYSGGAGAARFETVWTPENEGLFVDLGGDIINEELGYERNYKPAR